MISVIVPVYNVRQYLEEAIESILGQSFKDLEIILVDDGSTDGSGEICDAYQKKDARIRVIHQNNQGLSAARNAGLDVCTGETIAFLDPDDAFSKDALLKMDQAMRNSGADIVDCNCAVYVGDKRMDESELADKSKLTRTKEDRTGLYPKREALVLASRGDVTPYVWSKLYKRNIWDKVRFPNGQNYEDRDVLLPTVFEAQNLYILDEKLVLHRKRKGSITAVYTYKNVVDCVCAHSHYVRFIENHIPEYLDADTLDAAAKRDLHYILTVFFNCAESKTENKKESLSVLKEYIRELAGKTEVKKCGKRVRALYFMCTRLPLFLAVPVYKVYDALVRLRAKKK